MRKRSGHALFLVPALLMLMVLASSCAGPMAASRLRYSDELTRWTRSAKVYSGIEERLSLVATYRSPAFRDAYRDFYTRSFGLTDKERARLVREDKRADEQYTEFFISVHTSEDEYNNLDVTDSPWKIYLADSTGRRVEPMSVERLVRADPLRSEFFPYVDLWSTAYVLRFPRHVADGEATFPAADAAYIKLVVTSVLGRVEMKWDLSPRQRG
jgi:hypothetical protein